MKVLIIGSGAREHAIADAFSRSKRTDMIYVSPGNDGIADEFNCISLHDFTAIADFCVEMSIDLVFIGPEQPIAEGLSDFLRARSIRVFAPSQAAARLETSKAFAKQIMNKYSVPTAKHRLIHHAAQIDEILAGFTMPVVLKADGLAAGKGVIIAHDIAEARAACQSLLSQQCGSSGILVEEFLIGWEASLFAFCDGVRFVSTIFAQDHKQLHEGDCGPNTGGMGAYCPVRQAEPYRADIERQILAPVLAAMQAEGCPYTGLLYVGLMITASGPKVIEFNCRLGDPETQAVLPLLKTDIMDVCMAACENQLADLVLDWDPRSAVAVVLAAPGYPGEYKKNIPITIPELSSRQYFAGVKRGASGWLSTGGRVISVVALAETLQAARDAVYQDISKIDFPEMLCRKDIGLRTNKL